MPGGDFQVLVLLLLQRQLLNIPSLALLVVLLHLFTVFLNLHQVCTGLLQGKILQLMTVLQSIVLFHQFIKLLFLLRSRSSNNPLGFGLPLAMGLPFLLHVQILTRIYIRSNVVEGLRQKTPTPHATIGDPCLHSRDTECNRVMVDDCVRQ